jgi:hypothetical protein
MTERYTNEFYYKHALTEIANGEEPAREIAERMLKAVACLETVKPKPKDLATLGREIADA